jgi:hypothetical protein
MQFISIFTTNRLALAGLFLAAAMVGGCSKQDTPAPPPKTAAERSEETETEPPAPTGTAAFDACKVLSNEEIASIQGEAPARNQLVGESTGPLTVSQCNFLLPSGSNSIAVRVVERGTGADGRDPREVWKETFHGPPPDAADARYARKPEKVDGVGEEAFWLGNRKSGGLHVLAGDRYIRVSVGGQEEIPAKIEKCSKLSQMILPRLNAAK